MAHLWALVFIFGFGGCLGGRENFGYRNHGRSYGDYGQTKYYTIVGANNRGREDIWRPCSLDDYRCMGHFLSENSQCHPSHGYAPDPFNLPVEKFFFPAATMTITHLNAQIRGLKDAKVIEFYVNKASGNVVIAIIIPTYNFTSNAFFTYQRTAKEPIALNDYTTFETDNSILTAAIPRIRNLRLDLADVHAAVEKDSPRSYIGPGAYKSKDPAVISGIAKFEGNTSQALREATIIHSYLLMTTFIQKELCDFGLDSYRNYNGYYAFTRGYPRY